MKKMIRGLLKLLGVKKEQKDQETLRREYEEQYYDHYIAFGSAFTGFCSGK